MRKRNRHKEKQAGLTSPLISMGDIFAGMVGLMLLTLLFILANKSSLESIAWSRAYTTLEEGYLAKVEYKGQDAETIICKPDGLVLAADEGRFIPLADILTDPYLPNYLTEIYSRGERVLQVVHSGGNDSKVLLERVLSSLEYYDIFLLRTHSNLDFIKDAETREAFKKGQLENEQE
jgi:hypothetical protein